VGDDVLYKGYTEKELTNGARKNSVSDDCRHNFIEAKRAETEKARNECADDTELAGWWDMMDGEVKFQGHTEKELKYRARRAGTFASSKKCSENFKLFRVKEARKACATDTGLTGEWSVRNVTMKKEVMFQGRTEDELINVASEVSGSSAECSKNFKNFKGSWIKSKVKACVQG
jgi:hypothetical protein